MDESAAVLRSFTNNGYRVEKEDAQARGARPAHMMKEVNQWKQLGLAARDKLKAGNTEELKLMMTQVSCEDRDFREVLISDDAVVT